MQVSIDWAMPLAIGIALRPATDADRGFLQQLHRASMRDLVLATWGHWDQDWQAARWQRQLQLERIQLMVCRQARIGMLELAASDQALVLHNLQLLPSWQGQGIGGALLRAIRAEAGRRGLPLQLQVLMHNGRARRLYERQGLVVIGRSEQHLLMRWEPEEPKHGGR